MIQFLHMQGVPFHFLSNVLNSEIFSVVLIPFLIEFHNLAPTYMKHFFCHKYLYYISTTLTLYDPGEWALKAPPPPPLRFFALTHLILELHYCALVTFPKK